MPTSHDGPAHPEPEATGLGTVNSEFASVSVSIDHEGNSPRLRLEDLRSGTVRHVDALELESLIWASEEWWRTLLDPSLHRWRE